MKRRNGPRLEAAIDARLQELRDVARSGQTELTGKTVRVRGSGDSDEYRSRRFGGMRKAYPELARLPERDTPKKISAAISRGRGKVYARIRASVRRELEPYVREARTKTERPTVPAHGSLTAKCKSCGVAHGKGKHRFHGKDAFHKTHLFAFNPPRKRRVIRKNPPRVLIYGKLLRIEAQKTQAHACDPACARANHCYFHDFKPGAKIFGLPNGDLLVKNAR